MEPLLNRYRVHRFTLGSTLGAFVLLTALASPASAQSRQAGTGSEEWRFTLAPYLMLPWMDERVQSEAMRSKWMSARARFSTTSSSAQWVTSRRASPVGRLGRCGLHGPGTDIDRPPQTSISTRGIRVHGSARAERQRGLGLRGAMERPSGQARLQGPVLLGTFEETKQWVDPIVGLKLKQSLGGKWHFTMQGDIADSAPARISRGNCFLSLGSTSANDRRLGSATGPGYGLSDGGGNQMFKYDVITQASSSGSFSFLEVSGQIQAAAETEQFRLDGSRNRLLMVRLGSGKRGTRKRRPARCRTIWNGSCRRLVQ